MSYVRISLFAVCLFICFSVHSVAEAASLYIDPNTLTLLKGDTASVDVRLDTDEGECVNTVDATISYTGGVQLIDVSRGSSILTLWVEEPKVDRDAGKVTFAGGIPNGYCGRIPGDPNLTNVVATLVFRAPGFSVGKADETQALIHFEPETRVLLNDGEGTNAPLRLLDGTIELSPDVGSSTQDTWVDAVRSDDTPPQPFSIELTRQDGVYDGKYYVVFNTTDKQSGMDHYEIFEDPRTDLFNFRFARTDTPWVETKSPYVLQDQTLKSIIRVKAIDKAGNERIAVLIPDDSIRPLDIILIGALVGAGVVGALIVAAALYFLIRWYRKRRTPPVPPLE